MGQNRLTIAGLMILTALLAIIIAAVREFSVPSASLLYSLALGLNFAAVVAAIVGQRQTRSAAVGYAIFGWGQFFLLFINWDSTHQVPPLITKLLVMVLVSGIHVNLDSHVWSAFSVLTVAAGLTGGLFACWLSGPSHNLARPTTHNPG